MSSTFPKAKTFHKGYDPEWVDAFFTEARSAYEGGISAQVFSSDQVAQAAFPLVRGGYDTRAVDSALNRLEAAFVQRDRVDFIAVNGEADWYSKVTQMATTLYPRLLRPAGQRFSSPDKRARGYNASQVDELLDRLTAYFDENGSIEVADVRFALFSEARGTKAYREDQVDAYLRRTVEVLLSVA